MLSLLSPEYFLGGENTLNCGEFQPQKGHKQEVVSRNSSYYAYAKDLMQGIHVFDAVF